MDGMGQTRVNTLCLQIEDKLTHDMIFNSSDIFHVPVGTLMSDKGECFSGN